MPGSTARKDSHETAMALKDNKEWAPHVHNSEDAAKAEPWLRDLLEYEAFTPVDHVDPAERSHLERLLWIVGLQAYGFGDDSLPIQDIKFGSTRTSGLV